MEGVNDIAGGKPLVSRLFTGDVNGRGWVLEGGKRRSPEERSLMSWRASVAVCLLVA